MDLDIKRVLAAKPGAPEKVELVQLTTPWGEALDPKLPLADYPRPRLRRKDWTCLNGPWEYAIVESSDAQHLWTSARAPQVWDGPITVPFSPEAALSGVGRQLLPTQLLWYRRKVELAKPGASRRLLLHFGAVDYACACYVNGALVGTHVGAYTPFTFDISDVVRAGENTVELCVADPSEQGCQLRGKQRIVRGNMWYTAQSGIWQTVWLEEVPARRVCELSVRPDAGNARVQVRAEVSEPGATLRVELCDAEGVLVCAEEAQASGGEGTAGDAEAAFSATVVLRVDAPHLWDVGDPYLYGLRIRYDTDEVESYVALRTVGVEKDEQGFARFCLNHKPLFLRGLLDQGYWPDGLMSAPSDDAMVADIEAAHAAGFNMLRKHIKVEPERWYWHCDRLGMLVWQDMVSGGGIPGEWTSANIPTLVRRSWSSYKDTKPRNWKRLGAQDERYREEWLQTARATVERLSFHPCVVTWIVFNESWGQFCSAQMCEELRAVDGTRPYVATSGWYDQGAGDYYAVHNYFRGMRVYKDPHAPRGDRHVRAFVINEFGGLTCPIEGHVTVQTTYGYDTYEDVDAWRQALRSLLGEVDALDGEGLAGFVYTQLCDIEEETNGLLTYDRRVNKLA